MQELELGDVKPEPPALMPRAVTRSLPVPPLAGVMIIRKGVL